MQTSYFSQGRSDEKKALFPTSTTSLHLPVIRSVYTLRLCENGGLVRQSVHQFICMSIYRSVGLSVGPSVYWSVSPWSRDAFSDSPNHLYKVVCPLVRPCVRPFVGPTVRWLVHLSVHPTIGSLVCPLVFLSVHDAFCFTPQKWGNMVKIDFLLLCRLSLSTFCSFFQNLSFVIFLSLSLFLS